MNKHTPLPKLTARARQEIRDHNLTESQRYLGEVQRLTIEYTQRPPHGVPAHNMVKALRMITWQNTPEDWARLHVCEAFLKARKAK